MYIRLLDITSFPLEAPNAGMAVDQDLSTHGPDRHSISQDIQKGCLSGSSCSLDGGDVNKTHVK